MNKKVIIAGPPVEGWVQGALFWDAGLAQCFCFLLSPMQGQILIHSMGSSTGGAICLDPTVLRRHGSSINIPLQTENTVNRKVCCDIQNQLYYTWYSLDMLNKSIQNFQKSYVTNLFFFCSMELLH